MLRGLPGGADAIGPDDLVCDVAFPLGGQQQAQLGQWL